MEPTASFGRRGRHAAYGLLGLCLVLILVANVTAQQTENPTEEIPAATKSGVQSSTDEKVSGAVKPSVKAPVQSTTASATPSLAEEAQAAVSPDDGPDDLDDRLGVAGNNIVDEEPFGNILQENVVQGEKEGEAAAEKLAASLQVPLNEPSNASTVEENETIKATQTDSGHAEHSGQRDQNSDKFKAIHYDNHSGVEDHAHDDHGKTLARFTGHWQSVTLIVMTLVLFTLVFEHLVEYHHRVVKEYNLALVEKLTQRLFGELAILGMGSFILFVVHDSHYISKAIAILTKEDYMVVSHMLHEIHMLLFVSMGFYLAVVVYIAVLSTAAICAYKDVDEDRFGVMLTRETLFEGISVKRCIKRTVLGTVVSLYKLQYFYKVYAAARNEFNANKPSRYKAFLYAVKHQKVVDEVQFVRYISLHAENAILDISVIKQTVWMTQYVVCLVFYIVSSSTRHKSGHEHGYFLAYLIGGNLLCFVAMICTLRIHRIVGKLNQLEGRNPACVLWIWNETKLLSGILQGTIFYTVIYTAVLYVGIAEILLRYGVLVWLASMLPPLVLGLCLIDAVPFWCLMTTYFGGISGAHDTLTDHLQADVTKLQQGRELSSRRDKTSKFQMIVNRPMPGTKGPQRPKKKKGSQAPGGGYGFRHSIRSVTAIFRPKK